MVSTSKFVSQTKKETTARSASFASFMSRQPLCSSNAFEYVLSALLALHAIFISSQSVDAFSDSDFLEIIEYVVTQSHRNVLKFAIILSAFWRRFLSLENLVRAVLLLPKNDAFEFCLCLINNLPHLAFDFARIFVKFSHLSSVVRDIILHILRLNSALAAVIRTELYHSNNFPDIQVIFIVYLCSVVVDF